MPIKDSDIAAYYDQTLIHYRQSWALNEQQALHYGLWYEDTPNFSRALENTNRKVLELLDAHPAQHLLDAGCGVGGTSRYLARHSGCRVTGITLSEKQLEFAYQLKDQQELSSLVTLERRNYLNTGFPDAHFDAVYAIESACQCADKSEFLAEAYRLLKPGGKLVVIDFFQIPRELSLKEDKALYNWLSRWAVPGLARIDTFEKQLKEHGFDLSEETDFTTQIVPSAKRLYRTSLWGSLPSECYNLLHPGTSRYARRHYLSGYWQYVALKRQLWEYWLLYAIKPK